MNATTPCPECGKPLPAGSDHCPACLMAQAIASRTLDDGPHAIPPPPAPEDIADKFPQFEILECLGRGGMGVVYKARQKSLNRLVALKILAPERERDARFAERFAREAELLAKLSHPHIVTIHDFGETGGLYYLVMEFINGVNLRDLLREGKMPPEQALAIVPPICEALQFAHDHGIVHRDIKPENILLDREGRVKIADFGIATLAGDSAEKAGTPAYMAPEQSGGGAAIDHRADLYALGVVLYEMLTGERPTMFPVAPSRRVKIDVRLDEIVMRAMDAKPERRYQAASDFRTVVETVAKAGDSAPMPPPKDPAAGSGSFWKLLLHFAPAILLAIAWFTSGLERGAVLILSVVIVATLVIRAVAKGKAAEQGSDTTARWALGTLLAGLFGTPLLLSFTPRQEGVLIFGGACLLASLVLAIASWQTRLGRAIAWGWGGLVVAAGLMMIFWSASNDSARAETVQRMAEEKARLERIAALAREAETLPGDPPRHADFQAASKVYADLKLRLSEAERKAELLKSSSGLGPRHPARIQAEALVELLRRQIEEQRALIERFPRGEE